MKVGLLGTRHVHAEGLARCAQEHGATLVGAAENDPDAAATWSMTDVMDHETVLANSDAIIVAGTNRERVRDTLAASRAGLPVLTEKPVAATPDELEQLVADADAAHVMVALPVRFSRTLERARTIIRAGGIGTPLAARGTNHGQFPGGWFGRRAEAGGGALQDHVVHLSDALCWLVGEPATHAYACALHVLHPDNDVEDCGVVTLDYASGLFASIDCSWSRPESFPTWGDVWLEIAGTDGRLRIDPMATRIELYDDDAGKLRHVPYSDDDMTHNMVAAFLRFAAGNSDAPVTLADGVHASDTVFAAYQSVRSGQRELIRSR